MSCLRTNPFKLETPAMQLDRAVDAPRAQGGTAVHYRPPRKTDGTRIWALIRSIAALDDNSLYCNLLQCSHFAGTCALAEIDGRAVGWISGYLPPEKPDTLFVWQVAVHPEARGRGVGKRLIRELLRRKACSRVRYIHSTITRDNRASWALFRAIADELDAPMTDDTHFEHDVHFAGRHATEHLVEIGPFERGARDRAA
ncbi:MAG TPA: diaminobutyrate acetyltransferase [Kiloniellaceae bacterium]